jgi:hypothetical protein
MQQKVNPTTQKKFLCEGYLLKDFHLLSQVRFSIKCQISVQSMKKQNVQTPDPVSFIESSHPLLINTLECLKISAVHRRAERKCHSYHRMLKDDFNADEILTYLRFN